MDCTNSSVKDIESFRKNGYAMVDLICDYYHNMEEYHVVSTMKPNEIRAKLPKEAPENGEEYSKIEDDIKAIIIPGLTHWQHPNFFAYFPTSCSFPAMLGDLLISGLGVQGMMWITSPACTELETHVLDWLATILKLPKQFLSPFGGGHNGGGMIQGTASEAVVVALVAARWRQVCVRMPHLTNLQTVRKTAKESAAETAQREGLDAVYGRGVVYVSEWTHSSVQKGCMVVGIRNMRVITSDDKHAMCSDKLEKQIEEDIEAGYIPIMACATVGTTSTAAVDPLVTIGAVCKKYNVWLHVDGAYAGSFCILPELRHHLDGVELVDSLTINLHKCLLTGFDCSAFWVRDKQPLVDALTLTPEYLRNKATEQGDVIDYKDWEVPLGRRFRALKLWFVLRMYGVRGITEYLRNHLEYAAQFRSWVETDSRFELVGGNFSLVCFRLRGVSDEDNHALLQALLSEKNFIYLTHCSIGGRYTLRMAIGSTNVTLLHVKRAWDAIQETATKFFPPSA